MSSSALRATTPAPASSDPSFVSSPASPATSSSTSPAASPAAPATSSRPSDAWYRREPWLAVTLSAFVPVAVGFATPRSMHGPLLAVAAVLVVVGIGLLVRQGPTR